MFVHKCISIYNKLINANQGKSVWEWCPAYFIENKELTRNSSNQLYNYLTTETQYSEGAILTMLELKKSYNDYLTDKYKLDRAPKNSKISINTLKLTNPEYTVTQLKICKFCKNHHKKGCCDKYNRTMRTSKEIINNIAFAHNI